MNTNFTVIGLTRLGIKPESTAQETDAPYTTRPSELKRQNAPHHSATRDYSSRDRRSIPLGHLPTRARAAVSEGNTFPILANRDIKEGWFSLWSGISAAKLEETTCSLKFTWSKCKKVCLLWDLLFVSNFPWCCLLFRWLSTKNFLSHLTNTSQRLHRKSPAGVAENSSGYSWQVCLIFAIEDLACFGILCFASYNLKDHV